MYKQFWKYLITHFQELPTIDGNSDTLRSTGVLPQKSHTKKSFVSLVTQKQKTIFFSEGSLCTTENYRHIFKTTTWRLASFHLQNHLRNFEPIFFSAKIMFPNRNFTLNINHRRWHCICLVKFLIRTCLLGLKIIDQKLW